MPRNKKPSTARRVLLSLRVSVVILGLFFAGIWVSQGQRWANLKQIFRDLQLWVFFVAAGVFAISQIMVGLRWWMLLRTQGIFICYRTAIRLYFLGWFYNNVMPSSVGGDLIRLWYVTKHTDKKFEAALSVLVDRAIGLISTLIIAAFFYTVFLRAGGMEVDFAARTGLLDALGRHKHLLAAVALFGAAVIVGGLLLPGGRTLLARLWAGLCTHGAKGISKMVNAAVLYGSKPVVILAAFGITVAQQIMNITGFWFLGRHLGITASIKYYYVFFTLVWVLGVIPVSIGGAVVMEVILAGLFVKFAGVDESSAAALALCQRFVWILVSLPGGLIHLLGAHLPKDFFVDCQDSMK